MYGSTQDSNPGLPQEGPFSQHILTYIPTLSLCSIPHDFWRVFGPSLSMYMDSMYNNMHSEHRLKLSCSLLKRALLRLEKPRPSGWNTKRFYGVRTSPTSRTVHWSGCYLFTKLNTTAPFHCKYFTNICVFYSLDSPVLWKCYLSTGEILL